MGVPPVPILNLPGLKRGKDIPGQYTVARLIPKRSYFTDPITGQFGCFPDAFELRPQEVQMRAISLNLLNVFPGTKNQQLAAIRQHCNLNINPSHAFGVMNVQDILNAGVQTQQGVRVTYDPSNPPPPKTADKSHSRLRRLPAGKHYIFTLLAALALKDFVLSKHVP